MPVWEIFVFVPLFIYLFFGFNSSQWLASSESQARWKPKFWSHSRPASYKHVVFDRRKNSRMRTMARIDNGGWVGDGCWSVPLTVGGFGCENLVMNSAWVGFCHLAFDIIVTWQRSAGQSERIGEHWEEFLCVQGNGKPPNIVHAFSCARHMRRDYRSDHDRTERNQSTLGFWVRVGRFPVMVMMKARRNRFACRFRDGAFMVVLLESAETTGSTTKPNL